MGKHEPRRIVAVSHHPVEPDDRDGHAKHLEQRTANLIDDVVYLKASAPRQAHAIASEAAHQFKMVMRGPRWDPAGKGGMPTCERSSSLLLCAPSHASSST